VQKLYYSISEVSDIIDEEQHILRYWEKEFPQLKPKKNRGGNRIYSEKDLNIIKFIKKMLRVEKLSLTGAREKLEKAINDGTYSLINMQSDQSQQNLNQQIPQQLIDDNHILIKKDILKTVLNNLLDIRQQIM
jgi:DNA-binding transcriptional MerR regulator